MNDWQKILDLLEHEKLGEDKEFENPLIKKATEYLHRILQCLVEDFKKGKISGLDEQMKEIVINIDNDMRKCELKRKLSNMSATYFQMSIILKFMSVFQNRVIKNCINSPSFYKRHKIMKYDLEMLHYAVCKDMFQKMGNCYEHNTSLWVSMDVDTEEESEVPWFGNATQFEGRRGIKLEIISKDILVYDKYVFDMLRENSSDIGKTIKESYRPYLVEYYIDQKGLEEKQSAFLQQMYHEKGWYQATLTDTTTDIDTEKFITFEGVFVHSASPVEYEVKKLVIRDKRVDCAAINAINGTYNMNEIHFTSDYDIQKELEKLFSGISFRTTRVYKVGNGNCIYNYGKKGFRKKCFFYDIGFDMHMHIDTNLKRTEKKYRAALKKIRNSIPHCIILSHWDEDHFRGCVYAKKHFFDIRWITPNIKNSENKANAKRLFLYLYRIGSLMVVQRGIAREIVIQNAIKSQIKLYVGKRKRGTDKKITNCNCQGIAIRMENDTVRYGKIRCLMQGDVPYMSLPSQANFATENPYEYLVAPHHGAEMDCSLLKVTGNRNGQAVICCTNEREKNRPEKDHLCILKKCYNTVETTAHAKSYIQFDLRKKNHMRIF